MPVWPGPAPKPGSGQKPAAAGMDWAEPDYRTISRRQQTLRVPLPYRPSRSALDLFVDSTGIKFLGEAEWKRKKHGAEYRRQWHKVHLARDAQPLEVRAIEVTDNSVVDAPMLSKLLGQIPVDQIIGSVSGDGAYDTKACHAAIARRQAHAVVPPPRKNAQLWKFKRTGELARNDAVRACIRLGRLWKKWSGYHRRSLVETKMDCFKQLGERVMARTFERQVAELHVRVALLNRFTQLGHLPRCQRCQWHSCVWCWGNAVPNQLCATKPRRTHNRLVPGSTPGRPTKIDKANP